MFKTTGFPNSRIQVQIWPDERPTHIDILFSAPLYNQRKSSIKVRSHVTTAIAFFVLTIGLYGNKWSCSHSLTTATAKSQMNGFHISIHCDCDNDKIKLKKKKRCRSRQV